MSRIKWVLAIAFGTRWAALILPVLSVGCGQALAQPPVVAPPKIDGSMVRLAREVEPDLVGQASRLPHYVSVFRRRMVDDTRLMAFDVQATPAEDGRVALGGYVEFPETRDGLIRFLERLGFEVSDDGLETLPDEALGERRFGFVRVSHTLSYSKPSEPRSVVTDCLLGEPLYLLREIEDHLLVHGGDGYLGYVASADVHRVSAASFDRYPSDRCVRISIDHELPSGLVLPVGAQLKQVSGGPAEIDCALPTGEVVSVPTTVCVATAAPLSPIDRAVAAGKQMLGAPYHWGGKTSRGIDCSGLVQVAFAATGTHLPRDANQQAVLGQFIATRWHRERLRRGDTLYFLGENGRIRHTALYLGGDRYLQAVIPRVMISSLNPADDDYDEKRGKSFAFAKRLWQ